MLRSVSRSARLLVPFHVHRGTPSAARCFSSESGEVDVKLQEGFNSAWNRMRETWGLLAKNERDNFHRMYDEGVFRPSMLEAILCYVDLKNPLLHKYNFDYKDFMTGARHACVAIDEALFSQEFFDFANGKITESENADFLQSLLQPSLFNEVKKVAFVHSINDEQLKAERNVPRLTLSRVATRVVHESAPPSIHIPPSLVKEDKERFPAGSVIASIFVDVDMQWDNKETHNSWARHQSLVFDGCISDHVPCDWIIRQLMSTVPIPRPQLS